MRCKSPLRSQPVNFIQVCHVIVATKILCQSVGVTQALDGTIHVTCVAHVLQTQ
jgi:hypothetical protein